MRELHCTHHGLLVGPQSATELFLALHGQFTQLEGQLLALLEEYLFVHIFLRQDVLWMRLLV